MQVVTLSFSAPLLQQNKSQHKKIGTRMGRVKDQGEKNTKLHFVKVLMILELCNLIGLKLFT